MKRIAIVLLLAAAVSVYFAVDFRTNVSASWFEKDEKPTQVAEKPAPAGDIENQPFTFDTFRLIAKEESPSVVNISTTKVMKNRFDRSRKNAQPFDDFFGDDFFYHFFGPMPDQKVQSLGSGVIIDKDGYILTNNHVIEGVDEIKVKMLDGKTYDAKPVGADPQTDIALIKIESTGDIKAIEFGDSDRLEVGDWVMAIGNPFGFGHTVTVGVVSAKGRSLVMSPSELPYQDFIQTDASINPGNSGGPLIDIHGRLVGINSVIASRTGQSAGIGFAISVNMIKSLIPELKDKGSVTRGWLGVSIQTMDEELANSLKLPNASGALVAEVVSGSPAEKAGIKPGDVILEFDGVDIRDSSHLSRTVASTPIDKKVEIKVRRDDETITLNVLIAKREGEMIAGAEGADVRSNLGMTVQNLTPELARQMGIDGTGGVLISDVQPGGAADNAGLQRGDLILEINRQKIKNADDYSKLVQALKPGDVTVFYIQRGDSKIFIAVKITKE